MAILLTCVSSALLLWIFTTLRTLNNNRRIAETVGVPILYSPVGSQNLPWMILQNFLTPILRRLPFGFGSWVRYSTMGWNFFDKNRIHKELGNLFMVVTPHENILYVADAVASDQIGARRKEFLKPISELGGIDLFGETLASVEGADWQRHRRITAPPFNERNSSLVWYESVRQAREMLENWNMNGTSKINTVRNDTARLALHVLTGAGFGVSCQFQGDLDTPEDGFEFTYRDALEKVMSGIVLSSLMPKWVQSLPLVLTPSKLKLFTRARKEFKNYLTQMIDGAKALIAEGDSSHADLLHTLVQKSQESMALGKSASKSELGLSDNEIYGNLFIFSFAGHKTTANALSYTIYLLAANPQYQGWVRAEVEEVFKGHESLEALDYKEVYPQLKRCLALMHETLRLYPPVVALPKCTGSNPATIDYDGRKITVPPHTTVLPNVIGLSTNEEYWSEPLTWKPTRWIESKEHVKDDEMITPGRGTFIPWASGPRVCPGQKFSQVEFVAVIAILLWKHEIRVVSNPSETSEKAQARCNNVVEDSIQRMTIQMRSAETIDLEFIAR